MVNLLQQFFLVNGLKSTGTSPRPTGVAKGDVQDLTRERETFNWKWAKEGDLSKLMGFHVGFNLDMKEVDEFLIGRIIKRNCDIGDHCNSL